MTDHATWIFNKNRAKNLVIHIQNKEILNITCLAVLGKNPKKEVIDFFNYLKSNRAQKIFADFGKKQYGEALFYAYKK